MWGNSGKSKGVKSAKIETLVGRNTEITGDVHFQGGMHVDGTVRGNIHADDENCVISVSQTGVVEGDLKVPHVILDGTVTGDVYSSERLELAAHTNVNGDVYYNLVEMAVGASVNGKLVHKPTEQPLLLERGQSGKSSGAGRQEPEASRRDAPERPDSAGEEPKDKVSGG